MNLVIVKPPIKQIATVSVAFAVLLSVLTQLILKLDPVGVPLKTGFFVLLVGLFWIFFDRCGWKLKIAGVRIARPLCNWPDLNGRWEGVLNRYGENTPHKFVIEIF